MCGNSISHDRRFLVRYMPELANFFHYRNIDVSSVKELVKRWKPELVESIDKNGNHRALADVYESIKELKFYKENLFNWFVDQGSFLDPPSTIGVGRGITLLDLLLVIFAFPLLSTSSILKIAFIGI